MAARILVVEDEPDIAAVFRILFGASGHAVVHAGEVAAAREALERTPPDIVLLDVLLPDGDGLDLCREVKGRRPDVPVVVVTAEVGAREKAVGAGADLIVVKPFDPDELEREVERLLNRRTEPQR